MERESGKEEDHFFETVSMLDISDSFGILYHTHWIFLLLGWTPAYSIARNIALILSHYRFRPVAIPRAARRLMFLTFVSLL